MAKEFFKDLPNTTTPIKSSRLNGLLDGDESMGNLVVENIKTKNIFDKNTIVSGDISDNNKSTRTSSRQIIWLDEGTYTFSTNLSSSFEYDLLVQNVGIPPLSAQPSFIYNSGWISSSTQTFTLTTAGYFTIYIRKPDNSSITPSETKNFRYQLEKGDTATLHSEYQNLTGINDIYTSEEILIGIWLGKPLYRKVYETTTYATAFNVPTENIERLVDIKGMLQRSDYVNVWQPIPSRLDNAGMSAQFGIITLGNSTNINVVLGSSWESSFRRIVIIVEYTKTTD